MKDLIFIGGAKGTGKTNLINKIQDISNLNVFNTGSIFLHSNEKDFNYNERIYSALKEYSGIVDTHYAGYGPNRSFVRGLCKEKLKKLNEYKSIDLIIIELPYEELLNRRLKDSSNNRVCDIEHIKKELEMNRFYFNQYCKEIGIDGMALTNKDFDQSVQALIGRIEWKQKK